VLTEKKEGIVITKLHTKKTLGMQFTEGRSKLNKGFFLKQIKNSIFNNLEN
jgi:hypothetical protein